eukprot:9088244-Pyramimonas_sp.AAC.1
MRVAKGEKGKPGGGGADEDSDIYKIVKMCMDKNHDPVIVFSFSKKEVEALADKMAALDLTDDHEKELIEGVFTNAIDSLCEDDKKLPQVRPNC